MKKTWITIAPNRERVTLNHGGYNDITLNHRQIIENEELANKFKDIFMPLFQKESLTTPLREIPNEEPIETPKPLREIVGDEPEDEQPKPLREVPGEEVEEKPEILTEILPAKQVYLAWRVGKWKKKIKIEAFSEDEAKEEYARKFKLHLDDVAIKLK